MQDTQKSWEKSLRALLKELGGIEEYLNDDLTIELTKQGKELKE